MRRLLALAVLAVAAAAPAATGADYVKCVMSHNELPDPEYGGHGYVNIKDTVNDCVHPIVPKDTADQSVIVECVLEHNRVGFPYGGTDVDPVGTALCWVGL